MPNESSPRIFCNFQEYLCMAYHFSYSSDVNLKGTVCDIFHDYMSRDYRYKSSEFCFLILPNSNA